MSSDEERPPSRAKRSVILGGALLLAALGGAFVLRPVSQVPQPPTQRQARPIVQIVRQQPGLPDLADLIDRLCSSVAVIIPHGENASNLTNPISTPASAYSSDGWLVTSASGLPQGPLDAVFGDGQRTELSDIRTDTVSGLAIVRATTATAPPLPFSDQAFPRVGQFGFGLTTPAGTGCSASTVMVGSDFYADGGGLWGYVRLTPAPTDWSAGVPLLSSDGHVLGIGTGDPPGAALPAPIVSVILDELIRGRLSPSENFGFRAIDYAAPFLTRLGDVRSGAGVALVQPKSTAANSGLQAGDLVIAVDDVPISSASELNRTLDAVSDKAELTVLRRSQHLKLAVKRAAT